MPNRRTHTTVGAVSGGALAAFHARRLAPGDQAVEAIGGMLAGAWTGQLPDLLEPATSPCHRDVAHSCAVLTAVASLALEQWRTNCRAYADEYRCRRTGSELTGGEYLLLTLYETVWRLIAGALAGLQAGYASHLLLDGCTPSGLPVFLR
ncbi:MAG: metal-dependent hydrolase [Gemmatimonadaceae bacterium]